MFSFKAKVQKSNDDKKQIILSVDESSYDKILSECNFIASTLETENQPLMPVWKYDKTNSYYCKLLLSKARKEQYEMLKGLTEESIFTVKAMPYNIKTVSSGELDGISLYFQSFSELSTQESFN